MPGAQVLLQAAHPEGDPLMAPVWQEGTRHKWECPAPSCEAKGWEPSRRAAEKVLLRHIADVHNIR